MSELERLKIVLALTRILSASEGPKTMMKSASSKIKKLIHCENVILFIRNFETNELVGHYEDKTLVYAINMETIVGSCALQGALEYLSDTSNDLRWRRQSQSFKDLVFKQVLVSPIIHNGVIFGVLMASTINELEFKKNEIESFITVADQFGVYLENNRLLEQMNEQFLQVCSALGDAIAKKDSYTGGHTKRVGKFAELIAQELALPEEEIKQIRLSAALHDIGKIGIEDKILKKDSPLTQEEFNVMKMHPHFGHEILAHIKGLEKVVDGMRYHHERPDGTGYPYGLKGDEIPLIAQIISVADTFDAMISTRPYRKGLNPLLAHQEILKYSGQQFSPVIVEAFDRAFKKTSMYSQAKRKSKKMAS
jgi:HD-GYP domain-containing protein (c-di-GMP phosphodiesterase class II)